MGDDGTCASKCSTVTLPDLCTNGLPMVNKKEVNTDVIKGLGEGTTWTKNSDGTARDLDTD